MAVCATGLYPQHYSSDEAEESCPRPNEEAEVKTHVWVSFEDGVVGEAERNVVGHGEVLPGLVAEEGHVKEDQDATYYLAQSWKEEIV